MTDVALDPGIREIVELLTCEGFVTTDSGDGRSKVPGPDVIPYPHVVIKANAALLVSTSHAARGFLVRRGFGDGLQVQATYDPADESAIVLVMWP